MTLKIVQVYFKFLKTKMGQPHGYPILLTHKDSNLNKQNQNLLCYRYTMGHSERSANLKAWGR